MKKLTVTGYAGRDSEVRADKDGNSFVVFSIGVNVGTKNEDKTDWVDISCNGKIADIAKNYVKKGTKVLIEGFPTVTTYMNKENKPIGTLKVYANYLELLNSLDTEKPVAHENDEQANIK